MITQLMETMTGTKFGQLLHTRKESCGSNKMNTKKFGKKTHALIGFVLKNGNKKGYCLRGLERWMEPEAIMENRRQAWSIVLAEQQKQRQRHLHPSNSNKGSDTRNDDDQQLSSLYKLSSISCKLEAFKRAQQDASDASAYHKRHSGASSRRRTALYTTPSSS
mmetsp:Transcript_24967/g.40863  ORF Transcript_24967/g.40863 Transcript_24967/m.40863 type:complete len:163 (+) Transcript_24967:206-694(+)